MDKTPPYINLVFTLTTTATVLFVYFAVRNAESKKSHSASLLTLFGLASWMAITWTVTQNGFFKNTESLPPRPIAAILPPTIIVILLLVFQKTRNFIVNIPISALTYLHIIRVPVELVLWWLATHKVAPYLITFEGYNYDILSGVTAPFVAIFLLSEKKHAKIITTIWNLASLGLLINVVFHAFLSVPSPIQMFSFETPFLAALHTPFIWLPSVVVPCVLWSHLASLTKLYKQARL